MNWQVQAAPHAAVQLPVAHVSEQQGVHAVWQLCRQMPARSVEERSGIDARSGEAARSGALARSTVTERSSPAKSAPARSEANDRSGVTGPSPPVARPSTVNVHPPSATTAT